MQISMPGGRGRVEKDLDLGPRSNIYQARTSPKVPPLEHFAKAGLARAHHHEGLLGNSRSLMSRPY